MVCPIPRSGKLGFAGDYTGSVLTRYARFRNWTLNPVATPEARVYSGTRFGTQRIPGQVDYSGSFEGFGGRPPLFVGDSFTFIGYTAPTSGVPCTPGCAYIVPAMVNTLSITWNYTAENRTVFWSVGFQANGTPTVNTTFDDPCDDLVFCDPNICSLPPVMKNPCDTDAIVEFCNITQVVLTFTNSSIAYSNTSTNCELRREVGNLDFTLDITDQNPCIIPILQAPYWFELPDSTTTKWILKYAMLVGVNNFRVDSQTGAMIEKTNSFAMQAVNCCVPGTPVRGVITNPAGVNVWPFVAA